MNLYAITAANETTFVLATDMKRAVAGWNDHRQFEGEDLQGEEPDSIAMVADPDQLVMRSESEEMNALRLELASQKEAAESAAQHLVDLNPIAQSLQELKEAIMWRLGVTHDKDDLASDVDQKILAELMAMKAAAEAYQTYIEAKAGKATNNAVKMATLQHRVSTLETEVQIANDKLDAKEGVGCP